MTCATTPRRNSAQEPRIWTPRTFNKRTKQRFVTDRTSALLRHLGRQPSYTERILISRIVALEWSLRRIDAKMDAGEELSGHAERARLAAETRLRLDLRELGLQPTAAQSIDPFQALRTHLQHARVILEGEDAA